MKDSVVVCIFALKKYIEHKHCQENIHYVMEKWALKNKMNEKKTTIYSISFSFYQNSNRMNHDGNCYMSALHPLDKE